ncbi:MAG: methionine adenosyltransferase [Spirochaetes bacterium]|uniref:Methionine adenosyltransferase n=1 Tax=Candidatus Aphodenecus pullistercoris TaxID=2840669 RepID=A0A9D9EAI6_9SPIR|nr:methionine adenosyltransferase [Candidatus Aphodenecus pullistercoris]
MRRQFTSECVTSAHPDKLCDQISDALLDAFLEGDSLTRAAIETTACPDFIHVMGEVSTTAQVDVEEVARSVVRRVGYTKDEYLFTDRIRVVTSLHRQSDDIAMGVDRGEVLGAGDQGMMFGYATGECDNGMPLTMNLARALTTRLTEKRRAGSLPFLRPDGKGQVTIEYENGKAKRIAAVVLSAQHDEDITLEDLRTALKKEVILPCLPEDLVDEDTKYYINPTGRFVLGGPAADTGLTGRKLIVDTYGGWAPHGGGAFSGKDATKVDRSAAYAARNIALTLVRARIAKRCLVQLAYAIGVSEPVGIFVDTYSSGLVDEEKLARFIREHWDLSPKGIIDEFELRKPGYAELSEVGHFGGDQRWEKVDSGRVEALKRLLWDER